MTKQNKLIVGVLIGLVVLYVLNKKGMLGMGESKSGAYGRLGLRNQPIRMKRVTSFPNLSTQRAGKRCNCGTASNPKWIDWCRGGTCDECCDVAKEHNVEF